ncbi:MAG TPA: hypothetical protein VNJ08_06935 [Bacteriovoracaceae bacterium]|nr:hypothetical protein [Bacteriovoracaceae bacterium]
MFKQIILASIFISNGAFASHVILRKHVTSGNVRPEDSFVKNCSFTNDGHIRINLKKGDGTTTFHTHHISSTKVAEIKTLVQRAHSGRIIEEGATCDGGDNLLYGFISGHKVLLDENFDCGRHRVNQSIATPRLKTIALKNCGF